MGCKLSAQWATNREIDVQLKKSHALEKSVVKILLLGTGEAGKSTIIKQMKIIHDQGFSKEELDEGRRVIQRSLVESLLRALNGSKELSLLCEPRDKEALDESTLEGFLFEAFQRILKKEGVKESMISKESNHWLHYFISHSERVMATSYSPTVDDYLRLRQRTSGIIEYLFKVQCEITKGYPMTMSFRMIDVGGQRTERKKWIHCFEGVHAILFIVSLAEYDQVLEEDPDTNRMHESLTLFKQIFNNAFFVKSGFILFLNKTDLFEKKIKDVPLSVCFPEFERGKGLEDAKEYILYQFMSQCTPAADNRKSTKGRRPSKAPSTKALYHHFTTATDTRHIRFIFSSVTEMIIRSTLERTQLI